ncbi:restriction endonuclease subunit S [Stomatohabitans albus]|uniref:restriction endonuclease subunit S n=1 Tax=Stomatohabitans albus TaxID=3110766 RepID=UPI00300D1EB0
MSVEHEDLTLRVPLKRLARFRSGGAIDGKELLNEGEFPVYGGNGIRGFTSKWNIRGSNLLVGRQGALAGNVHRVTGPIWASEHALIASLSELIHFDFAYYLLRNMNLNQYSQAAAQPGISASVIQSVHITIPKSTRQQQDIAEFLDLRTAEIDGLIEKLAREVELLERYRRELIAHTVTRGLDPDAPMRDSGFEWIGEIPAGWTQVSLKSMLRRVSVKNEPKRRVLSVERANGVVDREREGSPDNHNRLPDDLSGYLAVDSGQFVMNKMKAWRGSYGVSKMNGIVSPAYYVFDLHFLNVEFFNWTIRSQAYVPFFGRDSYGIRTDQWDFKIAALRSIPFYVPPADEQIEIVSFLQAKTVAVDSAITDIVKQIELLGSYRKQVIHDAVTGKVRVGEVA